MTGIRIVAFAVALAAVALALSSSGGLAHAARRVPHYVWCTGTPPEYDPYDLNQMRASVSAASRLELAIREREFFASCRPPLRRHRHHVG